MRILIIGSLDGDLGQAAQIAIAHGARLDQADAPEAALERIRIDARFHLILIETRHDIGNFVAALAAERIMVPVIACGSNHDAGAAVRAIRAGAQEFLPLPPDPDLIAAILEAASCESCAMVVRDPLMQLCVRRAEQVATSDASILITGESGTGKELLARHVHRCSRRASGPLVAVNCAAIPESLLESELFGHEKGAFSGAVARRIGKFEAACGGTLLLDEVSEMDVRLQAKLLRALQEREIDRLGGSAPVAIDTRIIATTNRNLADAVRAGQFREDLFFRLNVITLAIPRLRDRPADIAALAGHFTRYYASVNGLPYRPLDQDALRLLGLHPWRGNVRELENTVHRAVLLAQGASITPAAIELEPFSPPPAKRQSCGPSAPDGAASGPSESDAPGEPDRNAPTPDAVAALVGRPMRDVERALILQTLAHTLGNRTHAAVILGISIRALRNRLREYAREGAAVPPPGTGYPAQAA